MKSLLAKLTRETFILDLATNPNQIQLENTSWRILDDHSIEVDIEKQLGLNAIFAQLSKQDVTVLSMRNKANRLEELFVSLVENGRGGNA